MKRSWYSIGAKAGKDEIDLFIYDNIGIWGVSANEFVKELNDVDAKTINLRINSPGGSVFDGVAIYNALKKHDAKVITHIESLAASIASIIALAGDEIQMADNAFYMIHNPYTWAGGDAETMRKTAAMLDKITDSLIKTYTDKTGKAIAEIKQYMDDETWFNAEEAKEAGFIDSITDEEEVDAAFDLSIYNNVPQHVYNNLNNTNPSPRKLEHALREVGGLSKSAAKGFVAKGYKIIDHREDDQYGGRVRDVIIEIENKSKGGKEMTRDDLKNKFPDIFNAIIAEGKEGLLSEDVIAKRVEEAVKAEGDRVAALDKLSKDMPGNEKLIASLKEDKTITAEKAALQVIAANGERLKGIASAQAEDADGLEKVPGVDSGDGGEGPKSFEALVADYMLENKCKKSKAISAIAASHSKEHAAYIENQNKPSA